MHDLSESEANRIVSRLHLGNQKADKVLQSDGRWAVAVDSSQAISALSFLETKRVISSRPVASEASRGSFIPSREEQWYRYESSVAAGIEDTLLRLPGVLDARVHLNLPRGDALLGIPSKGGGSGSVLLITESAVSSTDEQVASIVGAAAGVPAANVKLMRTLAVVDVAPVYQVRSAPNESATSAAMPLSDRAMTDNLVLNLKSSWWRFESVDTRSLLNGLYMLGFSILAALAFYICYWRRVGRTNSTQKRFALQNGYDNES